MSSGGRTATWWWRLSFGLAVTTGFVWLFGRDLEWDVMGRAIAGLSFHALVLAPVFLAVGWTLRIVRWWWLLRVPEPALPLGACAGPFLAGMAVNNLLPFRAGDALRVMGFRRQLRSPVMRVAGTIVIERILDVTVLVVVFFVCLLGVPAGVFPHQFAAAVAGLAGVGGAAMLAFLLFPSLPGAVSGRLLARIPSSRSFAERFGPSRRFPAVRRLIEGMSRHGADLAEALRLMRSRSRMLALLGLSAAAWFCEGAVFVTVAAAIHSGAAPPGPWFALATGTLATAIPSTPGYIGTFDYFAAQGIAAYGASPALAAAFAVTVHAVLWTASTVTGLCWLAVSTGIGQSARRGTIRNA